MDKVHGPFHTFLLPVTRVQCLQFLLALGIKQFYKMNLLSFPGRGSIALWPPPPFGSSWTAVGTEHELWVVRLLVLRQASDR